MNFSGMRTYFGRIISWWEGWMVFSEVISLFSVSSILVHPEPVLMYSIPDPMKFHVESLGDFLLHGGYKET